MQPVNPSNLSPEQKDELILQLFDHIATLTSEIKELKAQLAKNSRNSSKIDQNQQINFTIRYSGGTPVFVTATYGSLNCNSQPTEVRGCSCARAPARQQFSPASAGGRLLGASCSRLQTSVVDKCRMKWRNSRLIAEG